MKKRNFFLGLGLLGVLTMNGQTIFVGSPLPEEGSQTFYLYQVESGLWLQNNQRVPGQWTTHAQLDKNGFDVEVIKVEGGYRLNPKENGNHDISSGRDRFYMDSNNRTSVWTMEPATAAGVSNGYTIKALADEEVEADFFMGEADGNLSDNPANTTWQFISREERIEKMVAEVANGPVDATWLIPGQDLGRNDERLNLWTHKFCTDGSAIGLGGRDFNSVQEAWHRTTNYMHYITLKGLPNGTYQFSLQGWYRDTEVEDIDYQQRVADGTEVQRAEYFAGAASNYLMKIAAGGSKTEQADKYTYYIEGADLWVPNNLDQASNVFADGDYTNEWITAVVTDGTLTIGVRKLEADHRDWLVYDNFQLRYVSTDTPAQDLTSLNDFLAGIIAQAETLPATPGIKAAVDKAKAVQGSTNATELNEAALELLALVGGVAQAKNEINDFYATKTIAEAEGVDVAEAVAKFDNAVTRDDFVNALRDLRYARRRHAADRQEDVFKGNAAAVGDFYLYNIGQKQFLSGGSDWGAHAALSFPGWEISLEADEAEAAAGLFHINTHLQNGDGQHYLNYRGYMDAGKSGAWKFVAVEGKENVYNIVQGDYTEVHVAWNPYANVDTQNGDETTVGTENRGLQADDLNAQWKLVTRAEREALLESASIDNPVDATIFIQSPNFNQREKADGAWQLSGASIWEYGANHNDFAAESFNTETCDINQMVDGLPQGVYVASVQGFYRNGSHKAQPNLELLQNAYFYAGNNMDDEVLLPNITAESFNAPGEGNNAVSEDGETTYHYPDGVVQATNFFRSGLYRVNLTILKDYDGELPLGVGKDEKGELDDWIVVDNFRLTYYGNNTTVKDVDDIVNGIETVKDVTTVKADNAVYTLQGVRVNKADKPGLYIIGGKKVVVKK